MHFHLPEPLHGWRAFVGEVGIIVIGVLIALAAEQVVQSIHERNEVEQLRSALRGALADDRARWERMRAGDFRTEQRLNALGKWLGSAPNRRPTGKSAPGPVSAGASPLLPGAAPTELRLFLPPLQRARNQAGLQPAKLEQRPVRAVQAGGGTWRCIIRERPASIRNVRFPPIAGCLVDRRQTLPFSVALPSMVGSC